MSEIPLLRKRVLKVGTILSVVFPVYFLLGNYIGYHLRFSDNVGIAWIFVTAQWIAFAALLCGTLAKGPGRWKVIAGSAFEIFFVWFMSIGL
jgi:hypothetical protein